MSITCPNRRLRAWKDLVKVQGESRSYLLWSEYEGNVPEQYYAVSKPKVITPAIKSGVESLFDSNPELVAIGSLEQYSAYLDTIFPDYINNFAYEAVEELLVSNKIIDRKC